MKMNGRETTLKDKLEKDRIVLDVYFCLNLKLDKEKWEINANEKDCFVNKKEGEENGYTKTIVWGQSGW